MLAISLVYSQMTLLAARIAYDELITKSPKVLDKANVLLSYLSSFTEFEEEYPFVECATFPDLLWTQHFYQTIYWHFKDEPIFEDGYESDVAVRQDNVVEQIVRDECKELENSERDACGSQGEL